MADILNIAGRVHSISEEEVVTTTDEILDDSQNKKQSEINTDVVANSDDVANLKNRMRAVEALGEISVGGGDVQIANTAADIEAGSGKVPTVNAIDGALQGIGYFECTTGSSTAAKSFSATGYVLRSGGCMKVKMTNKNTSNNTVTLNINSTGAKALFYGGEPVSASNTWEAGEVVEIYYDPAYNSNAGAYYANNVAGGSGDGVFDISEYNKSGDPLAPTPYADLAAALGTNGANVPASVRSGGMSVKFINAISGKYEQWRLMAASWSTTVSDWQGVDSTPSAGSVNLITSGGAYNEIQDSKVRSKIYKNGYISSNHKFAAHSDSLCCVIGVTTGKKYQIKFAENVVTNSCFYVFTEDTEGQTPVGTRVQSADSIITAPQDAKYLFVTVSFDGNNTIDKVDVLEYTNNLKDFTDDIVQLNTDVSDINGSIVTINGSITSIENDIDEIEGEFGEIAEHQVSKNIFDKSKSITSVVTTNGQLSTVGSWTYNICTGLIPVLPNKVYQISGNSISDGKNIRCLGSDGTTYMKVLSPQNGQTLSNYVMPNADGSEAASSMNVQFKTPQTAAYVQFNVGTKNNNSTETAMIELVGDEYDPNFTPSEYEPYYDRYTIKESALPASLDEIVEDFPDVSSNASNAINRNCKIKLLLIGSSHGMNTIAQLPWMAYKSGFDIEVGNVYIGSLSLQRLVGYIQRNENISFKIFKDGAWTTIDNLKFNDVVAYANWDFISLQRSASDDEIWLSTQNEADTVQNAMTDINYGISGSTPVYMSHTDALQFILNRITEATTNRPNIIFNTGFADASDQPTSSATPNIISSVKKMKSEFGIEFYSTAIALRNARNTYLRNLGDNGYHNLCYDSQHLDYGIGCWVVSATLLEIVLRRLGWDIEIINAFGTQEELETFISVATPANYTLPTSETMSVAKACAKAACNKNDEVTEALTNRFKWQVMYIISDGITLSNTKGYSANEDIYTTTITGASSVTVTMGGIDVTSTVYNNGIVTISSVTGDVTITAN